MKIKSITYSNGRNDFKAIFTCPLCNYEYEAWGYSDGNFYNNAMPNAICSNCEKNERGGRMGRLINTSDLHNVVMKRKTEYGKLATLVDNIVEEMVKETPTAIWIPEGATNGDMIKAVFPDSRYEKVHSVMYSVHGQFDLDWWNAPYTKEVEE